MRLRHACPLQCAGVLFHCLQGLRKAWLSWPSPSVCSSIVVAAGPRPHRHLLQAPFPKAHFTAQQSCKCGILQQLYLQRQCLGVMIKQLHQHGKTDRSVAVAGVHIGTTVKTTKRYPSTCMHRSAAVLADTKSQHVLSEASS